MFRVIRYVLCVKLVLKMSFIHILNADMLLWFGTLVVLPMLSRILYHKLFLLKIAFFNLLEVLTHEYQVTFAVIFWITWKRIKRCGEIYPSRVSFLFS